MPTVTRPRDSRGRFISTRGNVPPDSVRLPDRHPVSFSQVDSFPRVQGPRLVDVLAQAPRDHWGDVRNTRLPATDSIGGRWVAHCEWQYSRQYWVMLREECSYVIAPWSMPPQGPSRFTCPRRCLYSDGCESCNPGTWRMCNEGCHGEESFRSPRNGPCRCWRTCEECEETLSPTHLYSRDIERENAYGGSYAERITLCDSCDENYIACDECGRSYPAEDEHDCPESCGCFTCRQESLDRSDSLIRYYSYKPVPEFHGDGPTYMGVEIEVSTQGANKTRRAIAEHVQKRLGSLAYLKSDSSIGDGFEIVTHPMSYRYAMDSFPWAMWEELQGMGMDNSEDCGLHIHVNRDGFSNPAHVYRWMKFFYRNERPITLIARRESDQWAPFREIDRVWAVHIAKCGVNADFTNLFRPGFRHYSRDPNRFKWYAARKVDVYDDPDCERYAAINNTNERTLEVRVFAGSVHRNEIQAAMAFMAASIEYTRQLTAHAIVAEDGWSWSSFITWAQEQGDTYAPLIDYVSEWSN